MGQTAMQELIQRLKSIHSRHDDASLEVAIILAEQLLEKEYNQIVQAHVDGQPVDTATTLAARQYYKEIYGGSI
jgi:hypothetical protein